MAAIAEALLGLYGLSVPLLLAMSFYFAVIGPWEKSTPLLLLPAFLSDSLSPLAFPLGAANLVAVILLAAAWRRLGEIRSAAMSAFPGMVIGAWRGCATLLACGLLGHGLPPRPFLFLLGNNLIDINRNNISALCIFFLLRSEHSLD